MRIFTDVDERYLLYPVLGLVLVLTGSFQVFVGLILGPLSIVDIFCDFPHIDACDLLSVQTK